jgi:folate-dependent phosphoribosylglycinamide formyltransferase PurN
MNSEITCYDYIHREIREEAGRERRESGEPDRPLNAVVLTSIRDVGECDRNGSMINIPEGHVYMQGLLEAVINQINEQRGRIADVLQVVGVITDDGGHDVARGDLQDYPFTPTEGRPWIHPLDLRDHRGELVTSNTMSIPSDFRALPLRDVDGRSDRKLAFENQVDLVARQMGADILISDHLMMRIVSLLDAYRGWIGKILNIHPAMTRSDYPLKLRGKTPTQEAIDRAQGLRVDPIAGDAIRVQQHAATGATLHMVNPTIDDGAVLCDGELTSVYPNDTPQQLRFRNYPTKIKIFGEGMAHYVENIFPMLDRAQVDWLNGVRPVGRRTIILPNIHN